MIIDLELNKEQKLMQRAIREYVRKEIEPIADELDRKGPMDKETAHRYIKELVPFGLVGSTVPEELGGPGLSHMDREVIASELIKVYMSLAGVVGISSSVANILSISPNTALRDRYLPELLSGDAIGCFGLSEPDSGSDPSSIQTTAVPDGDDFIVNGTKLWISNGTISDLCVCICLEADEEGTVQGIFQLLIDRRESPYQATDVHKLGFNSFPTSEVVFKDCRVPRANILFDMKEGFAAAQKSLIGARCGAAITSICLAEAALEKSIKYAKERVQFGKPIGKNQMIQQMIAEMMIEVEAAKLLTYRCLSELDRGILSQKKSSMAKAFSTEMGVRVTSKAIQIHGAYGLTEEYPLERYFRDARMVTIPDGTTQIQQLIVARSALGIDAL